MCRDLFGRVRIHFGTQVHFYSLASNNLRTKWEELWPFRSTHALRLDIIRIDWIKVNNKLPQIFSLFLHLFCDGRSSSAAFVEIKLVGVKLPHEHKWWTLWKWWRRSVECSPILVCTRNAIKSIRRVWVTRSSGRCEKVCEAAISLWRARHSDTHHPHKHTDPNGKS